MISLEKLFETSHCKVIELLCGSIKKVNQQVSHSVTSPLLLGGFQKRRASQIFSFYRAGCWERVGDLFQGWLLFCFYIKKITSEIFNVCRFKRRLGKREREVFLRMGGYSSVHYVSIFNH